MTQFEKQVTDAMPRLRGYARSLSGSAQDAEDLVQDCLELALRGKGSWRGTGLGSWLRTIMTHAFLNQRRKTPAAHAFVDFSDLEIADDTPLPDPLQQRSLLRSIEDLPPEFRVVLMLVVVEDQSYAEVADMLQIPLGTVMSRLSRARRMLSESLVARNNDQNVFRLRGRT